MADRPARPVFCTRCNANFCEHLRDGRDTLLSPREVDIIRAVCNPRLAGSKEIAAELGLSPMTVKVYLAHAQTKIGLPNGAGRSAQLVLWAMAHHEQLGIPLPKGEDFKWRL